MGHGRPHSPAAAGAGCRPGGRQERHALADRLSSRRTPPRREWVGGKNPVYEILRAGRRRVHRVLVGEGVQRRGRVAWIVEHAAAAGVPVASAPWARLDRLVARSGGVVAQVDSYPYVPPAEVLQRAREVGEPPLVLALDVLQDPQNLGTLLRTAEAVGVHGVILPRHASVGITAAVVSSSAGACEHLLVARDNLAQCLGWLKENGLWVVGLEASPQAVLLEEVDLGQPLVLVVGSEGEGMRKLVRQRCDFLVRLPMRGRVESLNAAVAGSLALYAIWAARGQRGAGFIDGARNC